eukprot:5929416-Pyramimonas_sp.AAC.1
MATVGPLYTWAMLVQDTKVPNYVLEKVFMHQRQILGSTPEHANAASPAGTVLVALHAINWRGTTATTWTTCSGIDLGLTTDSPEWLRVLARRDFINVKFEDWSRQKDHAPEDDPPIRRPCGYWMGPLKMLLAPKELAK